MKDEPPKTAQGSPPDPDENSENQELQLVLPGLSLEDMLPDAHEILAAAREKPESARYPLSTLEKNAARLDEILRKLAAEDSYLSIQKLFSIGYHTLKNVEAKYLPEIAERKKRFAHKLEFAAELQVDRLIQNPEKVPYDKAAITAAVLFDKALLARGNANSITKQLGGDEPKAEDFSEYVKSLPSAGPDLTGSGSRAPKTKGSDRATTPDLEHIIDAETD